MTIEQLTIEIEKVDAEAKSIADYNSPKRMELVQKSNSLYEARQEIYKAQAKAIREQIKSLRKQLEAIEENIW